MSVPLPIGGGIVVGIGGTGVRIRLFAVLLVVAMLASSTTSVAHAALAETLSPADPDVALLLRLINRDRASEGLPALAFSPELSRVAEAHAREMIEKDYFAHVSPTTGTPAKRAKAAGIGFVRLGENLCGHQSVEAAHQLLMTSKLHRGNILDPGYSVVGLAVVRGGKYGLMVVEMFIETAHGGE